MMKMRTFKAAGKAAGATVVAALSLSGLLLLSGCDERPYPGAANSYAPPPPAPLAGAPTPPPVAYAPPPPPPVAYAPPPPAYSSPPPRYYDPPAIVAMAPIPNPGDPGADGYYSGRGYGRRTHAHLYTSPPPAYAPPAYAKAPVYAPKPAPPVYAKAPKPPVYAPKPAPPAYAKAPAPPKGYAGPLTPPGTVKPYTPPKDYKPAAAPPLAAVPPKVDAYAKTGAAAVAATAAAVAVAGKDAAATAKGAADQAKATYNANKPAAAPPAPAPATPTTDRPTRLAALQSSATDAISKGAVLTAPQRFTANQPADVSLTIPAAFADTLRNEAQKDGLSDAAASVNMTAVLSGDGFSVTPDETQSQPLTVGQPTEFRWTVTAQPGAKGPLHADVGADLLGGGSDTLALGSVQKQAGFGVKPTPRMVGAAILVLILALVVVWLARGRGPSRPASARRASRAARGARPLDMGASES